MADDVTDERELIGLWSIQERYGPGAEEDTVALFRADRSGYYAWETQLLTQGCVFRWRIDGDRLTTSDIREFSSDPEGQPDQLNDGDGLPWRLDGRSITIGEEETVVGPRTVLRLVPAESNWDLFAKLNVHPEPRYMVDAIKRFG